MKPHGSQFVLGAKRNMNPGGYKFGWPCFIADSGLIGTSDESLLPELPDFRLNRTYTWLRDSPRLTHHSPVPLVSTSIVEALESINLKLPDDFAAFDREPDLQNFISWNAIYPDPAKQVRHRAARTLCSSSTLY
jgi:hypothetical protein